MPHHSAYGILVPWPGPWHWKQGVLTTGPLGSSWHARFVEWMYDCQISKRKKTMTNSGQWKAEMRGDLWAPKESERRDAHSWVGDTAVTHSEFFKIGESHDIKLIICKWCWSWSWSSNTLATWCEELTRWKRPWCWGKLKTGEEGGNRGWDGWMASQIQRTWAWPHSGR